MNNAPAGDLMARLAEHRALGTAPVQEHAWLVAHGELRSYAIGEVVTAKGQQGRALLVLFTGHLVIRMDRGAGSHKVFEWKAGDVGGVMPYSRQATPPNGRSERIIASSSSRRPSAGRGDSEVTRLAR